jgi:hypothetical protein
MDYGRILSRAWTIIWEHKWLILLGVLVALGTSNGGGAGGRGGVDLPSGDQDFDFDFDMPDLERELGLPVALIVAVVLVLASLAIVVGLILWIVATISRGGLIAGANAIDAGAPSSFGEAWEAGWRKGWRLIGIGVLPAIPALILVIVGLGATGVFAAMYGLMGERTAVLPGAGLGVFWVTLACIFVPIVLVLNLLQAFANRACMLEDLGVIAAYRRGLNVLVQNLGPALVLFLLQIVIGLVLAVVLFLPGVVMVICCILWPLLLLIRGGISAYFSTMWTLAWREWTGLGHVGEVAAAGVGSME